jgi:hypothetical protein
VQRFFVALGKLKMPSKTIRQIDVLNSSGAKFLELFIYAAEDAPHDTGRKALAGIRIFTQPDNSTRSSLVIQSEVENSHVIFFQPTAGTASFKAKTTDGLSIDIKAELAINLSIPCPLLWQNIDQSIEPIQLAFYFNADNTNKADIETDLQWIYQQNDNIDQRPVKKGKLGDLLKTFAWSTSDWGLALPPYLMTAKSDFSSVAPIGTHIRKISFVSFDGSGKGEHFLRVAYKANSWLPFDGSDVVKLFPFHLGMHDDNSNAAGKTEDLAIIQHAELQETSNPSNFKTTWKAQLNWRIKEFSDLPTHAISPLHIWNEFVAKPYFNSLKTVKDGSAVSILPIFETNLPASPGLLLKNQSWEFQYNFVDHSPLQLDYSGRRFDYQFKSMYPTRAMRFIAAGHLQRFQDHSADGIERVFEIGFGDIEDRDVRNFAASALPVELSTDASVYLTWRDLGTLDEANLETASLQFARTGALDIGFARPTKEQTAELPEKFIPDGFADLILNFTPARFSLRYLKAYMVMRVAGFSPGGQDAAPPEYLLKAEERSRSIVTTFPVANSVPAIAVPGPMDLKVSETCEEQMTQGITMVLDNVGRSATVKKIDVLVIDQNPFLVARVTSDANFSAEIGNFSGKIESEASWELQDEKDSMTLILPPQVVGEEFIRDYPNQAEKSDYCFSPNAAMTLSRSAFEQNFTEAPWNLRKLLGWSGQESPGANIYNLKFELLYGLTTQVVKSGLQLAEIGSLIGQLPARQKPSRGEVIDVAKLDGTNKLEEQLKEKSLKYNRAVYRDLGTINNRLSVLKVYSDRREKSLELTDGLRFRIRDNRKSHAFFEQPTEARPLAGGVDFGFESVNAHANVLKEPDSAVGKVQNLQFTALGGSGFQKATFLDGNLSIYSDTNIGRTFFYSVEMLGRIGILWNRAKHVVIYERSVVDTDRFVDGGKHQHGRAMIRKVDEYVEILQPESDFTNAKIAGFIEGTKYPNPIIKVDGNWSTQLEKGWMIPLHNLSAPQDLYPRPDVMLKVTAENSNESVWGRIKNPHQLVFFTTGTKAPVESWPAYPGVDFPLQVVKDLEDVKDPPGARASGQKLNIPPELRSGLANFTFDIDLQDAKVNLLKGRAAKVVEAAIENVTLSRIDLEKINVDAAELAKLAPLVAVQDQLTGLSRTIIQSTQDLKDLVNLEDATNFIDRLAGIPQQIDADVQQLSQKVSGVVHDRIKSTKQLLSDSQKSLEKAWDRSHDTYIKPLTTELEEVWKSLDRRVKTLEMLKVQLITRCVFEAPCAVRRIANSMRTLIEECKALEKRVSEILQRFTAEANELKAELESDKKLFNSFVLRYTNELIECVLLLKKNTANAFPGLLSTKIDLSDGRVIETQLLQKLNTLSTKLLSGNQSVSRLIADLTTFRNEVKTVASNVENALMAADKLLDKFEKESKALKKQVEDAIDNKLLILAKLEDWDAVKSDLETQINAVKGHATAFGNKFLDTTVFDFIKDYEATIGKFEEAAAGALDDISSRIKQETAELHAVLNSVTTAITKQVGGVKQLELAAERELTKLAESCIGKAVLTSASIADPIYKEICSLESRLPELEEQGMRLVRAYGAPPAAKALAITREKLEYLYKESELPVLFTKSNVLMNKAERALDEIRDFAEPSNLKSLAIDLPTCSLLDDFKPLKDLEAKARDLKNLLPDFAGINLNKLLNDTTQLGDGDLNNIKVSHGFDPTTKLPWARTSVDIKMQQRISIFRFGPVSLALPTSRFEAESGISIDKQGVPKAKMHGTITGTWQLSMSEKPLLTFRSTALNINNSGDFNFDIKPKNVIIEPPLNFISDLVSKMNFSNDSGLSVALLKSDDGQIPIGIQALLNIALRPLQFGAFSMSNLALSAFFTLTFTGGDLTIATGFGLASRERPFTMTIMCLGGGGWFTVRAVYKILGANRGLSASLSIGLALAANLAFDIGVAKGGVYFYFKVGVEWSSSSPGGGLRISLEIAIIGEVEILSIISASVSISLIAEYDSATGSLVCTGRLKVRIKICWCFTISVNKSVEMVLKGKKPKPGTPPAGLPGPGIASGAGLPSPAGGPGATAVLVARQTEQKIEHAVSAYMNSFGG